MDIDLSWLMGGAVTFAGIPLSDFCAKMQSYPKFSKNLDVETFQGRQRSTLIPIKNLITGMFLTAKIDFFGTSNEARTRAQSDFEALFRSQSTVEIKIGDGFFYRAVLISSAPSQTYAELITTVEYKWAVTRHTDPLTVDLSGTNKIWNPGNSDRTDCCIVVNGRYDAGYTVTLTLNSLPFTIHSGDNPNREDISLDGINKRFLVGSSNAASKLYWRDFPYLIPGWNEININVGGVAVDYYVGRAEFTPTYL